MGSGGQGGARGGVCALGAVFSGSADTTDATITAAMTAFPTLNRGVLQAKTKGVGVGARGRDGNGVGGDRVGWGWGWRVGGGGGAVGDTTDITVTAANTAFPTPNGGIFHAKKKGAGLGAG